MKYFTFLIAFLLFSIYTSFGQEKYRITYDYLTEETNYYKLNKLNQIKDTLSSPKFKRNSLIELKLYNINPFAVNVKTDVKEEAIHPKMNGFNFSSLLGSINSFSGESLDLNVNSIPEANAFLSGDGKSRGSQINNKFSDLNKLTTNIDAVKTAFIANLANPNIDKKEIIKNLKSISSTFQDNRLTDPNKNFYLFLSNLNNVVQEDSKQLENEISNISLEVDKIISDTSTLSRGELVQRNNAYSNLTELSKNISSKQLKTADDLNKIKDLYSRLEASNFEQTYDYIIESDKVGIDLKFLQSEFSASPNSENSNNLIKTRSLNLFSKGGFKINSGVALTINNFGSSSKDFFIDSNGVIGADTNNNSTPNLSTMINFYPVLSENFNIGASFGLSIPISGETKGINFLLGPTIFLGSESRLSLSGGVAYGTVNKLTNGLKVGDSTSLNSLDGFTKSVYDFGYYFGISFSLFEIK
jgi:hypothetical protein